MTKLERLEPLDPKHPLQKILHKFQGEPSSVYHTLHNTKFGEKLKTDYPKFHEALSHVTKSVKDDHYMDLHNENIMQRGKGPNAQPVITDPFSD